MDASTGQFAPQISGLLAGEDLAVAAPCFIHTDGKVYECDASAADAEARLAGFTPRAVKSGQPVTLFGAGARFHYADSGLTPGAILYIAATAGRLDTAATPGDYAGVAQAISATDIRIVANITAVGDGT
jgi:hypothetical protein